MCSRAASVSSVSGDGMEQLTQVEAHAKSGNQVLACTPCQTGLLGQPILVCNHSCKAISAQAPDQLALHACACQCPTQQRCQAGAPQTLPPAAAACPPPRAAAASPAATAAAPPGTADLRSPLLRLHASPTFMLQYPSAMESCSRHFYWCCAEACSHHHYLNVSTEGQVRCGYASTLACRHVRHA